ncbi:MAG TPA: hypothetical protein VGJ45_19855 [Pseudonocardiaceae bacterium]
MATSNAISTSTSTRRRCPGARSRKVDHQQATPNATRNQPNMCVLVSSAGFCSSRPLTTLVKPVSTSRTRTTTMFLGGRVMTAAP